MRSEHPATPRPIGQRPRVGRASPLLALVLLGATVLAGCLPRPSVLARPTLAMVPHTSAMAPRPALERLPLTIVENQGQLEPAIGYYVPGATTSIAFTPAGLRLALTRPSERAAEVADVDQDGRRPGPAGLEPPRRWTVALDFLGADPDARPVGIAPSAAVVSYFVGPAEAWRTGLPTYGGVAYPALWPGIDLVYQGAGGQLKYEYRLQPGADPAQIQLAYRGATDVRLADDGALVVTTPLGGFRDAAPYAYQEIDGQRVAVSAAYALAAPADGADERRYGFQLGAYDPTRPLVLDPAIVVYGGYIGGPQGEDGYGIAVDQNGNVYVVGQTFTPQGGFPVLGGPDLSPNGSYDAFVAKVRPDGTGLVYAGYIGGAGGDNGLGVAVDAAGSAYVVGETDSTEATFPVVGGPRTQYGGGARDGFVAKVRPDGTGLVYSGFVGGTGDDSGTAIAVNAAGSAYLTGSTSTTDGSFPAVVGPDLTPNLSVDAFVAKVRPDGSGFVYAGFIGGISVEEGNGIAVDGQGQAYVVGRTSSDQATFPVLGGPDLTPNGLRDAFVAKVRADGTGLIYAGYLGGTDADVAQAIAVDGAGSAYVTGFTRSPESSFPVFNGPDRTFNGDQDAFVAKVRPDGTGLVYAGYLGGAGLDLANGIAVDGAGFAYVVGSTESSETQGFRTVGGPDPTFNGGRIDAFIAKVRIDGLDVVYAGYIGGAGSDFGNGVAVDAAGTAYVVGTTSSSAASFPVAVGPDLSYNGISDAFVVKIAEPAAGADLSVGLLEEPEPVPIGQPVRYTLRVDNSGPEAAAGVTLRDPLAIGVSLGRVEPSQGTCQAEDGVLTCALGRLAVGARATVRLIVTPTVVGALALTVTVSSDVADPNRANNRATARTAVLATAPDVAALPDPKTDREKARRLTEEQRQQRRRTDASGLDDTRTEGDVVGTRCQLSADVPTVSQGFVAQPETVPYLLIGMRDGVQQVLLLHETASQCASVQVGDYLQADGEKVHEQLFEAHHATVTRGGQRVR